MTADAAAITKRKSHRAAATTAPTPNAPGFGIYIHWPFCASKCPYCDFNSHVRQKPVDEPRFLAAFRIELATLAARAEPAEVTSIFFGGGTPSLMQPATVGAILDAVAGHFPISNTCEITLEANPSSVEAERFAGYRAAGVNRVSLGVQALADRDLRALGRLHSAADARAAMRIAAGTFARTSFDLIYARPEQTTAAWRAELREALDLAAGHLSLYQLTIEAGTPFHALQAAGKLIIPDLDTAAELYDLTTEETARSGLAAYEVSNYARPGEESRHNLVYWRYGAYLGIGPGAHGRIAPRGNATARIATSTERNPERWLERVEADGHGLVEDAAVSCQEMADEMLVMGLRLAEGFPLARLQRFTGLTLDQTQCADLITDGLIAMDDNVLTVTPTGRLVLNSLAVALSTALKPIA